MLALSIIFILLVIGLCILSVALYDISEAGVSLCFVGIVICSLLSWGTGYSLGLKEKDIAIQNGAEFEYELVVQGDGSTKWEFIDEKARPSTKE